MFKHKLIFTTVLFVLFSVIFNISDKKNNTLSSRSAKNNLVQIIDTDTIKPIISKQGNPYITHYRTDYNKHFWAIQQDGKGQMIFAHNQGISIFNGESWTKVKIPATPISLKYLPEHNLTLVGCDNQFGYLKDKGNGEYEYTILSNNNVNYGEITNIELGNSLIYFGGEKSISIFNRKTLKKEYNFFVKQGQTYNGMVLLKDKLCVLKSGEGLYSFGKNGEQASQVEDLEILGKQIVFAVKLSEDKILLGISDNNLYCFNGETITKYESDINKYISDTQLITAINLPNDKIAIGTLSSGLVVIDKTHNKVENIINYQNGLSDDEIIAMYPDEIGNIWVSHGGGISKINFSLPVKDYNFYPGIEGVLMDVLQFDSTIYVATSEGVYYLSKLTNIEELKFYEQKIIEEKKQDEIIVKALEKKHIISLVEPLRVSRPKAEETTKKNFFQRWKDKRHKRRSKRKLNRTKTKSQTNADTKNLKQKAKNNVKTNDSINIPKKQISSTVEHNKKPQISDNKPRKSKKIITPKIRYITKEKQILSFSYIFKKIKNLNTKCKKLIAYEDRILVASNKGLYEIKNKEANEIIKNVHINTILSSKNKGFFYIGTDAGLKFITFKDNEWGKLNKFDEYDLDFPVLDIVEDSLENIWIASEGLAYRIKKEKQSNKISIFDFSKDNPNHIAIRYINNSVYFISQNFLYKLNYENDKIFPTNDLIDNNTEHIAYITSQPDVTWLKFGNRWKIIGKHNINEQVLNLLNLFKSISNIKIDKENNIWLIDGHNKLYKISQPEISSNYLCKFNVFLQYIETNNGEKLNLNKINLPKEVNSISLKMNAPYYLRPQETKYQYIITPIMSNWSEWKKTSEVNLITHSGSYTIRVRAKNIFGKINESKIYNMNVEAKIWEELWFHIVLTIFLTALVFMVILMYQKQKQKSLESHNLTLELEVEKRTAEIKEQKNQLQKKNKEIIDSINYGRIIQVAILPKPDNLRSYFNDYFVLNKPRNIVSGDFYWFHKIGNKVIVTVGDCTGHGVPGAFLSILGVNFLNEIVYQIDELHADTILNILRERVVNILNREEYENRILDGMDLALIIYNTDTMELEYAGANNSLYMVRNGDLTEFKANKMPIGLYLKMNMFFTQTTIQLQEGDSFYMFSDGYMDQFGGERGRKFLSKNFKKSILKFSSLPMPEQKNQLNKSFEKWKGDIPQLDDVMVLGVRI